MKRNKRHFVRNKCAGRRLLLILAAALFLLLYQYIDQPIGRAAVNGELSVHFIDVGQGDAALILSDGEAMLIDTGIYEGAQELIDYIHAQGVQKLTYAVATHPHSDHIGAMDEVITKFPIESFLKTEAVNDNKPYRYMMEELADKKTNVINPQSGDSYQLGQAQFTVLAPLSMDYGSNLNNSSIVIRLDYGDTSFLFTGDAEIEEELDLVENGIAPADVLKVGHHGSETSSSNTFLDAVRPACAVISCGRGNRYGHPDAEVLKRLEEREVEILRTDEKGSIVFHSDGKELSWSGDH